MSESLHSFCKRIVARALFPLNGLDRMYFMGSPWAVDSEKEQYRYRRINELLREAMGGERIHTLLEFGCGEGAQTAHLAQIADSVLGVDISRVAIARAKRRVPRASFEVGSMDEFFGAFEVVTAFEALYYYPREHLQKALDNLEKSGSLKMVGYHLKHAALDAYLLKEGRENRIITYGDASWRIVWWK